VVAFSWGRAFSRIVLALWQVRVKPLMYGVFQISETVLVFIVSVIFVVVLKWGWRGGVAADTLVIGGFGLLATFILWRSGWIKFAFNSSYIRDILLFNTPLIFHLIGRSIITMSDRIFITRMVDMSQTGLYAAGYQVGMIIFLLTSSFNNAWLPHLQSRLKKNQEKDKVKIVKFTYLYFACVCVMGLILGIIAPWFVSFFLGEKFLQSSQFVIWISMGFAFNGMYWIVANYIYYLKKTHIIAAITCVGAVMNIVLNYVLIRLNGAIGAAQATAVTFLTIFLLTWIISARLYKMPWGLKVKRTLNS
jgi:O-antigen/teichoic acid export membrane protein